MKLCSPVRRGDAGGNQREADAGYRPHAELPQHLDVRVAAAQQNNVLLGEHTLKHAVAGAAFEWLMYPHCQLLQSRNAAWMYLVAP